MVPHALTSRLRQGLRPRCRRARGQRGAVTVELGLLLPILVLIILGIVGFGLLYNAQLSLQGAVREGARVHALRGDDRDPVAVTQDAAGGLDVDVTASSPDPCEPGEDASVTATYDYEFDFLAFTLDRTLSATAVMRCERGGP